MVRLANINDLPVIMKLSRSFYESMDFDRFGYHFDPIQISKSYQISFEGSKAVCVVNEQAKIDGVMLVSVTDTTWYFSGPKIATEIVWHVDVTKTAGYQLKTMEAMRRFMRQVLIEKGVSAFYISSDKRFPTVGKMLAKKGCIPLSEFYFDDLILTKEQENGIS